MFTLPMMLWKDLACGGGWLTTCRQLLGLCVVTSIWLKWRLTKIAFFPFTRQLGKGKPGTTFIINWAFFIPISIAVRIVRFGALGWAFSEGMDSMVE